VRADYIQTTWVIIWLTTWLTSDHGARVDRVDWCGINICSWAGEELIYIFESSHPSGPTGATPPHLSCASSCSRLQFY